MVFIFYFFLIKNKEKNDPTIKNDKPNPKKKDGRIVLPLYSKK